MKENYQLLREGNTIKQLKYTLSKIAGMDYKKMFSTISEIHEKSGKSRAFLFCDMVACGFRYSAGYKDYELWGFQDLTAAQRATYVTRGMNNRIVRLLNDPAYYHYMENKVEFNRYFSQFVHRQWLDMSAADFNAFSAFMETQDTVIAKPVDATCGEGVEKLQKSEFQDLRQMYDHLRAAGSGLVEECIIQHPKLSEIYPLSVNTYRIITVLTEGQVHIVHACIRLGNGGMFVDNVDAGGMTAPVRVDTGVIECAAVDKNHVKYETHPTTGCRIPGYELPFWKEAVEMCVSAAQLLPQIGYVGWDVAVSEGGPQLIEGNHIPSCHVLQMPPKMPDRTGKLPLMKQLIKGL